MSLRSSCTATSLKTLLIKHHNQQMTFAAPTFDDPRIEIKFRAEQGEGRLSDLDAWNAFEQAHPDTFKGMYQLLALRPDDAAQAG